MSLSKLRGIVGHQGEARLALVSRFMHVCADVSGGQVARCHLPEKSGGEGTWTRCKAFTSEIEINISFS